MNVLFINSFDVSPKSGGGVNRIVYVLSRKFMEIGNVNCFLGFFEDNPEQPADFEDKIKFSNPINVEEYERFLVANKIDIVHVNFLKKHNVNAIPTLYKIAKKNNVKVISCFHVCPGFELVTYSSLQKVIFDLKHNNSPLRELKKMLITWGMPIIKPLSHFFLRSKYKTQFNNCDKVVVLSKNYIEPYAKLAGVKDFLKFSAVGNALSFDSFATQEEIINKQKEVLIVARMEEQSKRLSLALKIWKNVESSKELCDWKLTIVGPGQDKEYYEWLAKKLKLKRCSFEGLQAPMEYYKRASIFLMTSSAEGWPMSLTEAIQMGTVPVVYDSFGSIHDIVKDGKNGIIVPNNQSDEFIRSLKSIMKNDAKRIEMANFAIESSKFFMLEKIIQQWNELYNEILLKNNYSI